MFVIALRAKIQAIAQLTFLVGSFSAISPAWSGQTQPNFGNFLGAMINQAMTGQLLDQWNARGAFEHECLAHNGLNAYDLASQGIGPFDPRAKRLFAQCRRDQAPVDQPAGSAARPVSADFAVSGLAAGRRVDPTSGAYAQYKCHDSQQFGGFHWCARKRSLNGKFGPYESDTTILHSDQNVAAFVIEEIVPAFFERRRSPTAKRYVDKSGMLANNGPSPSA